MGFFYYDWTMLLLIPPLILGIYAQFKVNSTYKRYEKIKNVRGLTAREVTRQILDANGLYHVKIEHIKGKLSDHYDPKTETVRLSDSVDGSDSVAAIGVAAHECGHAVQHANGYVPLKLRSAMVPITNFSSNFAFLFVIVGLVLGNMAKGQSDFGYNLAIVGVILFAVVALFQLVTLPVEFNASSRALKTLENDGILYDDELTGAKKVLTAAALTYVAALISSLASLLRIVLIVLGGRRND